MNSIDLNSLPRAERRRILRPFVKNVNKAKKAEAKWGNGIQTLQKLEIQRAARYLTR